MVSEPEVIRHRNAYVNFVFVCESVCAHGIEDSLHSENSNMTNTYI